MIYILIYLNLLLDAVL